MSRIDNAVFRLRATRRIDADPTSTALLLAGPTALDLWPGVRRVGEVGGRVLVEADLRDDAVDALGTVTAATVRALPPRRTPMSYVTTFAWTGPGLPVTDGELVLTYALGSLRPGTTAVLTLDSVGLAQSALLASDLVRMADVFLDNLARAAEARCQAA
ncbi:MAG: hypothetical protein ABIO67_06505 [Mycobacteriales bacterium]